MSNVYFLNGFYNFFRFIVEHWTSLIICLALILVMSQKIIAFMQLEHDKKVEIAWKIISEKMLACVMDAEIEYQSGTGRIKRSAVIAKVYEAYPILNSIADQEEVLAKIDELINMSLVEMKKILSSKGGNVDGNSSTNK